MQRWQSRSVVRFHIFNYLQAAALIGFRPRNGADNGVQRARSPAQILVILKTRTDRDFTRYKSAAILRRIFRRIQLNYIEDFNRYISCFLIYRGVRELIGSKSVALPAFEGQHVADSMHTQLSSKVIIRQIKYCDICRDEKEADDHWIVSYDYRGERRVDELTASNCLDPGHKRQCSESLLLKLLSQFLISTEGGHTLPG